MSSIPRISFPPVEWSVVRLQKIVLENPSPAVPNFVNVSQTTSATENERTSNTTTPNDEISFEFLQPDELPLHEQLRRYLQVRRIGGW